MPYKSDAQRRFFNSKKGKEIIGKKEVEKWNKESKGLDLPEKVGDALNIDPNKYYYSTNPNLPKKKGWELKGSDIIENAKKAGYNVYSMNQKTFKKTPLSFEDWFNKQHMKNWVEATDAISPNNPGHKIIRYKGYGIEYNLYGEKEYTVQYAGDDMWFKSEQEAKKFIDEVKTNDSKTKDSHSLYNEYMNRARSYSHPVNLKKLRKEVSFLNETGDLTDQEAGRIDEYLTNKLKAKDSKTIDDAHVNTKIKEVSRTAEVEDKIRDYFKSIGKDFYDEKYHKVIVKAKDILGKHLSRGSDLEKDVKRVVDRLLKDYSLDSKTTDATWQFTGSDNSGKNHNFKVKASSKEEAIKKSMEKARKEAKGDLSPHWNVKLVSADAYGNHDIYHIKVNRSADDREVSRLIGVAQSLGFTVKDKGTDIYLLDGDDSMFNKFKYLANKVKGIQLDSYMNYILYSNGWRFGTAERLDEAFNKAEKSGQKLPITIKEVASGKQYKYDGKKWSQDDLGERIKTYGSEEMKTKDYEPSREEKAAVRHIAEEVIKSHGKNNSIGLYDRFIMDAIRSWAGSGHDAKFIKYALEKSFEKYKIPDIYKGRDSKTTDSEQEYTFSVMKGGDLKKVKVSAKTYADALSKVKEEAKGLRFKGKKVSSKFDGNKLDTRDF